MSESDSEKRGSPKVFEILRDRPTPELDGRALWQQIARRLEPRRLGWWQRLFPTGESATPAQALGPLPWRQLSFALAGAAITGLALWLAFSTFSTPVDVVAEMPAATGPSRDAHVVWLEPGGPDATQGIGRERPSAPAEAERAPAPAEAERAPEPATSAAGEADMGWSLEVRLARGYNGSPPEGVRSASALGAGGASALADVVLRVAPLLPFEEFGLIGRWQGELRSGKEVAAALSGDYALGFTPAPAQADQAGQLVRLEDVRLVGTSEQLLASILNLQGGRLYLLGVQAPGEAAPSLIVAIRAEPSLAPGTQSR